MPINVFNDREVRPYINFDFDEIIYGYKANTTYKFHKSFLGTKLYEYYAEIPTSNISEGKELFNKINKNMVTVYKKKSFYFNKGVVENLDSEPKLLSNFGTDNGAAGVSVTIEFYENKVTICVIKSE